MSLINDVLRNLEANRPDDLASHNLQREIRSLPAVAPARTGFRLTLLAGLLLALAAAAWQWHDRLDEPLAHAPPTGCCRRTIPGIIDQALRKRPSISCFDRSTQ